MIVPVIVAVAVFALLSLPGWLLAADRPRAIWFYVATGFASQFAIVLGVALISLILPGQIDVRWTIAVAIGGAGLVLALRRPKARPMFDAIEGWAFVVPILAMIVAAAITRGAITYDADGLIVRAWFNADGFKHLGHVQSLAHFGLPARDIFAAGGPLAYYWFFYVIPATGAALHGNAAGALIAAGLIQTFAFWIVVHGLLRSAGTDARWATMLALIGWLSPTPDGIVAIATNGFDLWRAATGVNSEGMSGNLLNASSLFRAMLYVPQHQWTLAGLLSWGLIQAEPKDATPGPLRLLALAPFVCAGAVSTLFGVGCLAVYAAARGLDNRDTPAHRGAEIAIAGSLTLAVPLLFAIAGPAAGQSGLDSPLFAAPAYESPRLYRFIDAIPGIVFAYGVVLLGLFGLREGWRGRAERSNGRPILVFITALIAVGLALLFASTLTDNHRIAQEFQLRTSLLPFLGLTIAATWLLVQQDGRQRLPREWVVIAVPLLTLGLATPLLDTIWHVQSSPRWQVRIPNDDLTVLAFIDRNVPRRAVVLQYPEMPYVAGGKDLWTPIFAGRMIYSSARATHWDTGKSDFDDAKAYFDDGATLPGGRYEYIYLSRALHPATFDRLAAQLRASREWREMIDRRGASLWQRR